MITAGLSRVIILVFGILYPAYNSYKAIRTKNVKEYVRWMMHWIVMACFQLIETFSDVFLCWFPFYYEAKVCIVFWLLSPMTKGSSILYKKFIHPKLSRHEQEIDEYINQAKTKGYTAVIQLGTKSFDYASKLIVETAIKATTTLTVTNNFSQITSTSSKVIRKKNDRDVIDGVPEQATAHVTYDTTFEDVTMNASGDNELVNQVGGGDSLMHGGNVEFSDIEEPLVIEPVRITRSQSRTKEPSQPPSNIEQKKKGRPKKNAAGPKRRRRIRESDEENEDD